MISKNKKKSLILITENIIKNGVLSTEIGGVTVLLE